MLIQRHATHTELIEDETEINKIERTVTFDDGTYIHAETGDLGVGEMSGMEWGTVSISANNFLPGQSAF